MLELLKRVNALKTAQESGMNTIQANSMTIGHAIRTIEEALVALEAGLTSNNTVMIAMLHANSQALNAVRGEETE